MDTCFICLRNEENLINVNTGNSESENQVIYKLKNFVPELDWSLKLNICSICVNNLHKAYEFKQLCTSSYLSIKNKKIEYDLEDDSADDNSEYDTRNIVCESRRIIKIESDSKEVSKNHQTILNSELKIEDSKVSLNELLAEKKNGVIEDDVEDNDDNNIILPGCELCGTTFKNNYLLKRHKQNVHATEKKFACDICCKTFVSLVYLNAHKRYHSRTRPHICSFCGKSFITASDLYHHEKIHANKRAYQCEICPKAFNTSSDLHKHKICVHTDREDWKYICSYCDKRFPLKVNLDSHIKTHTGEKKFSCHLCHRKCINKSILMRHIETHKNEIAFHCEICSKGYKYKKSLTEHKAKIHKTGEVGVLQKNKKHSCHFCPKTFFASNKLERHVKTHTGEKPFQCPSCHKCFADKSYIKQHLRTMHASDLEESKL